MTGITISYLAGRYVGLAALRRVVHIPDEPLRRVEHWFHRAGGWLLTFGYFIPGVRHVTAIAAGSSGLGYATFAAFAYPGAILWSSFFVTTGYVLGDRWRPAFEAHRRERPPRHRAWRRRSTPCTWPSWRCAGTGGAHSRRAGE